MTFAPSLQVRRHCVSQVNLAGTNMVDYNYKDIEFLANASFPSIWRLFLSSLCNLCFTFDRFLTTLEGLSLPQGATLDW